MFSGVSAAAVVSLCALSCGGNALAYRPFEGTDAAVADPGELEIEFGPVEPLREGSQRFLTAPETVFNLGIAKEWEAIIPRAGRGPAFSRAGPDERRR